MTTKTLGLCKGRHDMPVEGYIFKNEIDPLDVDGLDLQAYYRLRDEFPDYEIITGSLYNSDDYGSVMQVRYRGQLNLYVTGLTVALVAVLNAAIRLGVNVILYHYDKNSNSYYPQQVLNYIKCYGRRR